jgi:lysozyme
VDYPVSFVYIKSTQGTSITNKYYTADYENCRRENIRVGAYHFFSTKVSGKEQAAYFLANTHFRHGDMPPVLDIEPNAAQIEQMGGIEELFRHIRDWLQAVEKATAMRPLLYVNQNFVNKHLDLAPDLKEGYHFWIARYGEYKPDIHLALWQLSADGQVSGIRGHVDLNVFNGYELQWQEFLDSTTKKSK